MFGSLHCRGAFVPSLRIKLREKSPGTLKGLERILEGDLSAFERVVAPLPGGHTMTINLVKEENSVVKRSLPGPAWMIVRAEPTQDEEPNGLRNMEICGTFTTAGAANQRAKELLGAAMRDLPRARQVDLVRSGLIFGAAIAPDRAVIVEAKYGSGIQFFDNL